MLREKHAVEVYSARPMGHSSPIACRLITNHHALDQVADHSYCIRRCLIFKANQS
jgi:hypothetical protein